MMRLLIACALFVAVGPAVFAQADYPGARWVPASSSNFTVANRPTSHPIRYVVLHTTQGSYAGAISWFQNPNARVSAHFVLRSSDGEATQMVRFKDIAWHAGNWTYNTQSIGIEHEGWFHEPQWFTQAMYRSSTAITRFVTNRYNIPRTRTFIIGHREVPGVTTQCPGPNFNFDTYMAMLRHDASFVSASTPPFLLPGETFDAVIRLRNTGDEIWPTTGANAVFLGTQDPQDRISPFFTPGNWISGNRAARATAVVNPGQEGEFRFRMTAPTAVGTYRETFQLVREGITWFGPRITFDVEVGRTDRAIDNDAPGVAFQGGWQTGTTAPGKYGADYRFLHTLRPGRAIWPLNAPMAGRYDIYAWWSQGTNRSSKAAYRITRTGGQTVATVDQTTGGGRWNYLGRHHLPAGSGFVELWPTGEAGRVVIADAVRIVGPY
ncbi:MAG: N-acetylmuramoyl-L-alanine amidase [Fimbriimonadaceae bacterium]